MMINIIIAEDQEIYLDALVSVFSSKKEISIVATAENGKILLEKLRTIELPDLALLDIRMDVLNGIETAKIIKKDYPELKIIMLTMHSEVSIINQLLRIGVHGYLLKNTGVAEMLIAFRTVVDGGVYYDEDVKEILIEDAINNSMTKSITLSTREKNILGLICAGNSIQDVAKDMNLNTEIINSYIHNLLLKTSTDDIKSLIRFAYENNMVEV